MCLETQEFGIEFLFMSVVSYCASVLGMIWLALLGVLGDEGVWLRVLGVVRGCWLCLVPRGFAGGAGTASSLSALRH